MHGTSRVTLALAACLALGVAPSLHAQRPNAGLALVVGTQGVGAELEVGLNRVLSMRSGFTTFSLSRDEEIDDIPFTITPRLSGVPLLLDVRPFRNAFRLSAGGIVNLNRIGVEASVNEPIEIGDAEYLPSEITRLNGTTEWARFSPYVGLGVSTLSRGGGRVYFTADAGVLFHGASETVLSATGPAAADAAFRADLAREAATVDEELGEVPVFPVVRIGIGVRF